MELVRTTTHDGLRLDGCFDAAERSKTSVSVDAVILLHGVGGSFYSGSLLESLAAAFPRVGVASLRVNTRGHDSVSVANTSTGPKWQGAAYETVSDCVHDVDAWCQWLMQRGCSRILLAGHSLGAIKVLFAAARQPPAAAVGIAAISPPRLSYRAFQNSPQSSVFFESMSRARELQAQGRLEQLFVARFPFPLLISAASYLDKYGPEERYNILNFLADIDLPTLFVYGGLELRQGGVAFADVPEAIKTVTKSTSAKHHVVTVPDADHFYAGVCGSLEAAIISWLQETYPSTRHNA